MFDIGFSELILLMVLGLVVLGPKRLPIAIRTVMDWVKTIRGLAANVQNELKQELKLQELQDSIKKVESLNLQALSPELSKTVEELKAQADKMKAELEDKAAQAGTTVEEQIKEIKSAAENAEKPQNAISVEEAAETLSEAEKTPTDLTALETHEKVELNTHLSSYYPPDDIEIAPASKSQSSKTKS
ncbi:Sec-independent protein translocase protein TatB [Haemophilus influenzae]|uniref:Sec-independent protein translocase protein TatB n=1 Tax=Haemophilus influenzae (strain PittGG) TaxID=374931 RepID=A5UFZ1_HAEIG|nr:Sec-independent protein translocase protein TatB [Haemophilus influenzae]ABQ99696.1 sec-independent translocase [Haemophilus influenzae PittGG]MCK8789663.1 Sec-independent protein translocase protein TatB [Haemophilus influenzae]MCK8864208.1 Sec-independent protein translocase protein TatB [Haemophilus influenzae]MCK8946675.1 Sec-independent protein translocase protein TatB [Haemophilus influenzae]MCK9060653.1 Sec-independent protein translocase protein TatB [Haemophilus influenzae]